jgi:two-component system chemotaxis response regulator CheB
MRDTSGMTLVLIADDSDIVAASLEQLLERDPHIHVVGRARNGRELVAHPALRAASVVLLDLLMPELGGLSVIRKCGQCAVIAVSSEEEGSALAEEARALGAVGFFSKRDLASPERAEALREAVKAAGALGGAAHGRPVGFVVGSTGAIRPLENLVNALRGEPLPLLVVQHLPDGKAEALAELLHHDDYPARVARHGDALAPGVLIAPAGSHMEVDSRERIRLTRGDPVNGHRPSGDVLLSSALRLGERAIAIVLSGLGNDGALPLGALAENGGRCFAQHPDDCQAGFMPRAALEASPKVKSIREAFLGEIVKRLLSNG